MKAALRTRGRILRARHIQHLQAVADAAQADSLVASLEAQSWQIASLSEGLVPAAGATRASDFASASELAMRLRDAQTMLGRAIDTARAGAGRADALRIEARIRQESAERLVGRARDALADEAERRAMLLRGSRRRMLAGGETA